MIKGPQGGMEIYKKRRKALMEQISDGVAILPAQPEVVRNNDVYYEYRQESSFYYLSGFTEPESVILLDPSSSTPFILFVRERDPARELWDGFRYGIDGAQKYFGADKVYSISEFEKFLPDLLAKTEKVYYRLHENRGFDEKVMSALDQARQKKGRTGLGPPSISDIRQIVGEMRLFKSNEEIELLRKAGEISARGHVAGMRFCKPGVYEYEIQAEIEREFRRLGSQRLGYNSIVGSGANTTVLHYIFNRDRCEKEHLLLVDAGAEYGYVTGDVTRSFPVSGIFSSAQKRFYETVLRVQKECVSFVKPGVKLADIHQKAVEGLTEGLLELGLLRGNKKEIIEKRQYVKYFPHGTSHWLGMDVHDLGLYMKNGEPRRLESSMCFTVEPGLYVPENDASAPAEFRGMGVRIEDDVVVTAKGCEILTSGAPKEVAEIEAIVGKSE